jgi:tetratricopeptide (TPR) repeat protein
LLVKYQANPNWHERFVHMLAGVLAIRGKLAESGRLLSSLSEARAQRGEAGAALVAELLRITPAGLFKDQPAARTAFQALLKANPPERLPELERPLTGLIRTAVAVGDREAAGRYLDEFSRNRGDVPGRAWDFLRDGARGDVLTLRNETMSQGLASYRKAVQRCDECFEAQMAAAFDRAGQTDSALVHYQHWAEMGDGLWEAGIYSHSAPIAYFRLGELYEAKGDKTKAVDYYGRFTNLWREADPELQPKVKQAKQHIADLVAEPRRP